MDYSIARTARYPIVAVSGGADLSSRDFLRPTRIRIKSRGKTLRTPAAALNDNTDVKQAYFQARIRHFKHKMDYAPNHNPVKYNTNSPPNSSLWTNN